MPKFSPIEFFKNIFRRATPKQLIGRKGENVATKFLKAHGLKILVRNFRSGRDEIDIVALETQTLVFVEVKTRAHNDLAGGYYAAMQKRKRAAVRRCAQAYISALARKPKSWRFDIVEVDANSMQIRHFENVDY